MPPSSIHSREQAKAARRLRLLDLSNVGKILDHDRYWTVQFIHVYLEHCEDVLKARPHEAHKLVGFMPLLITQFASVGDRVVDIASEADRCALHVWSLAILAASLQRIGQKRQASQAINEAHERLLFCRTAPLGEAKLRCLEAESWPEAVGTLRGIQRAVEIYNQLGDHNRAAKALILRGQIHRTRECGAGAHDWTRALELANGRTAQGRRLFDEALDLLLTAAKEDLFFIGQEVVVVRLSELARHQRRRRRYKASASLDWIVGQIYLNLGICAYGRQWLKRARQSHCKLGQANQLLEVSLTMASSMQTDLERPERTPLARATCRDLAALDRDDLVEAIDPWLEAPESLDVVEGLRKERIWVDPPRGLLMSEAQAMISRLAEQPTSPEEVSATLQKILPMLLKRMQATERIIDSHTLDYEAWL